MQFVEGLPGSAKTDLIAFMYLWQFCFTELRVLVSSQQNRSNLVLRTTVLEMVDGNSPAAQGLSVLVARTAWKDGMSQFQGVQQAGPGAYSTFSKARLAICTMGSLSQARLNSAGGALEQNWDHHVMTRCSPKGAIFNCWLGVSNGLTASPPSPVTPISLVSLR